MDEKAKEGEVKLDIAKADATPSEDEKHDDEECLKTEKPLEKMTKAELLEKIQDLKEESDSNYDLFLRSQAEIENIKKRNIKEKAEWVKYAGETLIKGILPSLDNLEQAISHSQNENPLDALMEGVDLTLKGLKDNLAKSGLVEVKTEDEPFDPCFHQAVSEQADEKIEAGKILLELQKGYMLHERLIRPAMVIVSKGNQDSTDN